MFSFSVISFSLIKLLITVDIFINDVYFLNVYLPLKEHQPEKIYIYMQKRTSYKSENLI